jgi:hypothetical protein
MAVKDCGNLMGACSMLKKLNGVLNILIISLIGAFAGHAIYVPVNIACVAAPINR